MRKIFLIVFAFLLLISVSTTPTSAKVLTQKSGKVTVAKTEVINDDLFMGSESAEMDGTVNGDVFIGAGTPIINGIVNGNLIVAGGTVTVEGTVKGDVIAAGGNVSIQSAKIGGSLVTGAGSVQIDDKSSIGGSLVIGTGSLVNKAPVGRNLMVGAGQVDLDSKVLGEARIGAGQITLGSNTKIGKDLWYSINNGKTDIVIPAGASVAGQVNKVTSPETINMNFDAARANMEKFGKTASFGLKFISFLSAIVIGFLWIKFFGKKAARLSELATQNIAANIGFGFLALILIFPAVVLLMITIIGFPLALMLLALFGIAFYFTKIIVGLALGNWLSSKMGWKNMSVYLNFSIGILVFYLVRAVPVLGGLFGFLVACVGLGAIIQLKRSSYKD